MRAAALVTLLLANAALAGDFACRLEADDEAGTCSSVYWRTRFAALVTPSAVLWMDGKTAHPGLSWTLAVDVPAHDWHDYYALNVAKADVPNRVPSYVGVAASFVWFPNHSFEGRLVLRARVISLPWPTTPAHAFLHLVAAAGASWGTLGVTPRIELRLRFGHLAWGGLTVAAGFQPYLARNLYVGDVAVGLEAPWVWWW